MFALLNSSLIDRGKRISDLSSTSAVVSLQIIFYAVWKCWHITTRFVNAQLLIQVNPHLSGQVFEVICGGYATNLAVVLPVRIQADHNETRHFAAEVIFDLPGHLTRRIGCRSCRFPLTALLLKIKKE